MLTFVRRAPVTCFAALAYLIAWVPWFVAIANGQPFAGLFSFGPLIAAFLVAACLGRDEVALLFARLIRWRVPAIWWLIAILVAFAPLLITAICVPLLGGTPPNANLLAQWPRVLATFPMVLLIGGPLGEEIGWRGFGVSKLVEQGKTPLTAALLVGVIWAGWHLPLFLTHKMPPPAAIVMIIGAVTLAWLYLKSGESALLLTVFHAIGNTFGGSWFFGLFAREDIPKVILLRVTVELAMAALVVAFGGKMLGLRQRA